MQEYIMNVPTLKEIEQSLFFALQRVFGELLQQVLEEIDQTIAEQRNKKRYYLKDKRKVRLQTLLGEVEVRRNYYVDREKGIPICLLDHFLAFDGAKSISPLLEETAIELAVSSSSYRRAAETLETIIGYAVMSHETIRQLVLEAEVNPHRAMPRRGRVLLVEADGLYVKRQRSRQKGKEEKILTVHEGWETNGQRVSLVNRRYYVHQTNEPVWEGLERFLMEEYRYDPFTDRIVINGDGASWITACREYFGTRAFFQLDRFHVAREIRFCLKDHPRYRAIRRKLASFEEAGWLVELESAGGTLGDEEKEAMLQRLILRVRSMEGCLSDYRIGLKAQGIETTDMRPMGSTEGTMHVFAQRLKNGRSWSERGFKKLVQSFVAWKDGLVIHPRKGKVQPIEKPEETTKQGIVKKTVQRAASRVKEVVRDNLAYLRQSSGTPLYQVLKGLRGI